MNGLTNWVGSECILLLDYKSTYSCVNRLGWDVICPSQGKPRNFLTSDVQGNSQVDSSNWALQKDTPASDIKEYVEKSVEAVFTLTWWYLFY